MVTRSPLQVWWPAVSSSMGAQAVPHSPSRNGVFLQGQLSSSWQKQSTHSPSVFQAAPSPSSPLSQCRHHFDSQYSTRDSLQSQKMQGCAEWTERCQDHSRGDGTSMKAETFMACPANRAWHYIFSIQMSGESQVTFINLGFTSASWLNA